MRLQELQRMEKQVPRNFKIYCLLTLVLSAVVFLAMHIWDNKFNWKSPQGRDGHLVLSNETISAYPLIFLTEGWALYQDVLLTPEEIDRYAPDTYIKIGEYRDMRFGEKHKNPHGYATYRLQIDVSGHVGDNIYTLQLPEIYSAYRLYINGELMQVAGSPDRDDGYEPLIFTGEVTFKSQDVIDIIFAVANFSHYEGGLTTPPAFGDTIRVNTMVQGRLIFRAAIMGSALMLGLLIMLAGARLQRKPGILFLLLVMSFLGFTAYTIVHALIPAGMFWFYFETFCYYAMFFLAIWLLDELCGIHSRMSLAVKLIDAGMCVMAIVVPIFLSERLVPMYLFYFLSRYYKLFLLLYISISALVAMWRGARHAAPILCGMVIFAVAAVVDLFMPARSAIITGEPIEIGCFLMILIMGTSMAIEVMDRHRHGQVWRDGRYLEERAQPLPDTEAVEFEPEWLEDLEDILEEKEKARQESTRTTDR